MVPEGWTHSRISDVARVTSGGTPSRNNPTYWNGSVPWVRTTEVQNCVLTPDNVKEFISDEGHRNSSAKLVPKGTILLAMIGQGKTRGQVALLTFEATTNQNCAAIIPNADQHSAFHFYFLLSQYENIRNLSNSAGQSNLSGALVRSIKVPVPPLPEQKKIAKILSTWDEAIVTTEQLLANSQQQKKALMQQLLTGKKRFPGFEGEWKDQFLTQIADVIVSPVDKKTKDDEIPVELCNYTDVYYNNYITRGMAFMKASAKQSEIDRYTLQHGDVIITKDSETPVDIAIPSLVSENLNGVVCGYHLAIVRTKEEMVIGDYLNFLFSTPKIRYYFFTLATGATRFGLTVGGIQKAHFRIPPLDEQRAIVNCLRNTDAEIVTLQQKLERLKQEKKALMQQLLTGKRRVKIEEEIVA